MILTPELQAEYDELSEDLGLSSKVENQQQNKYSLDEAIKIINEEHKKDVSALTSGFGIGFGGQHHGQQQFWNMLLGNPETGSSKEQALIRDYEYQKLLESGSSGNAWVGKTLGEVVYQLPVLLASILGSGRGAGANIANAGAQGAIIGMTQYVPEGQSRTLNTATGAAFGAAPDAILSGGKHGASYIKNKLFGSTLSEDQLRFNMSAAEGTETDLGQILENPWMSKFNENIVSNIPGSGGQERMARVGGQMQDKAESLLFDMTGRSPDSGLDLKPDIEQRIIGEIKNKEDYSEDLYKSASSIADKSKVKVSQESLGDPAKKQLNYLNRNPSSRESLEMIDKGVVKAIEQSAGFATPKKITSGPIYENTKNIIEPSLRDAGWSEEAINSEISRLLSGKKNRGAEDFSAVNNKRGDFLSLQRAAEEKGKGRVSQMYGELASGALQSMEDAALKSGKPEVINSLKEANSNFANVIIPMRNDKDIYQYAKDFNLDKSDNIVSTIIQGGKSTDYYKQIDKFKPYLGSEGMKELIYSYFNKATNKDTNLLDVRQFSNESKKLGPRQEQSLGIPSNEMSKFNKLISMNPKSLSLMYNPETGAYTKGLAVPSSLISAGYAAGGWLGAAAALPIASSGASRTTRELSDPKFINDYINKLLSDRTKGSINNDISVLLSAMRPQAATAFIQSEPKE